jgi:hypothetical protein
MHSKFGTGKDIMASVADDNLLFLGTVGNKIYDPGGGGCLVSNDKVGSCVQQRNS